MRTALIILAVAVGLCGGCGEIQNVCQGGTPVNTHFLKITYNPGWALATGWPQVGYAGYESCEKMETCRDNLVREGHGAVELTREEYEAAIKTQEVE